MKQSFFLILSQLSSNDFEKNSFPSYSSEEKLLEELITPAGLFGPAAAAV
jgi:hypothetical protein